MSVENGWLSLDPIYLSLPHPHKFSDNFSDMDRFQVDGYTYERRVFCNTILLKYHDFYLRPFLPCPFLPSSIFTFGH